MPTGQILLPRFGCLRREFPTRQGFSQNVGDIIFRRDFIDFDEAQRHLLPDKVNQHQEML